ALRQQIAIGAIDPRERIVVCVLTGHGLKDPGTAVAQATPPPSLPATLEALESYLGKVSPGRRAVMSNE
ncbi:MAG: hypothetical protein AB1791_19135, partial [Chloroflexota bacterium]